MPGAQVNNPIAWDLSMGWEGAVEILGVVVVVLVVLLGMGLRCVALAQG